MKKKITGELPLLQCHLRDICSVSNSMADPSVP